MAHHYNTEQTPPTDDELVLNLRQADYSSDEAFDIESMVRETGNQQLAANVTAPRGDRVQCETCGQWLAASSIRHHREIHLEPRFPCGLPGCDEAFTTKRDFNRHQQSRKHNPNPPRHVCYHCSKNFGRKDNRQKHVKLFHDSKPWACVDCQMTFKDRASYHNHGCASNNRVYYEPLNMLFRYQCCVCPGGFSSSELCKEHMRKAHHYNSALTPHDCLGVY